MAWCSPLSCTTSLTKLHFSPSWPPSRVVVGWWWGRPQSSMTQTSKTKSVAISLLKQVNGHPMGLARPLFDVCVLCWGLVAMVPQPPSHPTARTHTSAPSCSTTTSQQQLYFGGALSSEAISLRHTGGNCLIEKRWSWVGPTRSG